MPNRPSDGFLPLGTPYLPFCRSRLGLPSSCHLSPCAPRPSTPADPPQPHHLTAASVSASETFDPSPSASLYLAGSSKLKGVRSPLRLTWFPVYASTVSFATSCSSTAATLGKSWLAIPLPCGAFLPTRDAKLTWRTNVENPEPAWKPALRLCFWTVFSD